MVNLISRSILFCIDSVLFIYALMTLPQTTWNVPQCSWGEMCYYQPIGLICGSNLQLQHINVFLFFAKITQEISLTSCSQLKRALCYIPLANVEQARPCQVFMDINVAFLESISTRRQQSY